MEINGVAHTFITAGDFERSRAFYRQLLPFLGMREVLDVTGTYYCVGGRTGFGVRQPSKEHVGERFVQNRVGLHHICFRVRTREEVEEVHDFLVSIGAGVVHAPQDDDYAPGYYSVLFEDPDGVRLEVNHVPGQGLLAPGGSGHVGAWPKED
jgi:catechol 2,3-dioxygenase-like lactoylglutathione lyase family enzyme